MEFVVRSGWGRRDTVVPEDAKRAMDLLFAKFTIYRQALKTPKIVKEEDLQIIIKDVLKEMAT